MIVLFSETKLHVVSFQIHIWFLYPYHIHPIDDEFKIRISHALFHAVDPHLREDSLSKDMLSIRRKRRINERWPRHEQLHSNFGM